MSDPPSDDPTSVGSGDQEELVRRAQAGNTDAYTKLYTLYKHPIHRRLESLLGDPETAHDLAQEVFTIAWQALPTLRNPSQFKGWLFRIARHRALDHLRRWRLRGRGLSEAEAETTPGAQSALDVEIQSPEDLLCQVEDQEGKKELLKRAFAELPLKKRQAVYLRHVEGLKPEEIARRMKISKSRASSYVSAGRQELLAAFLRLQAEKSQDVNRREGD